MGVTGAVLASVAAVIIAYLFATPGPGLVFVRGLRVPTSFREGLQAIVFFAGQVIINNFDIPQGFVRAGDGGKVQDTTLWTTISNLKDHRYIVRGVGDPERLVSVALAALGPTHTDDDTGLVALAVQ